MFFSLDSTSLAAQRKIRSHFSHGHPVLGSRTGSQNMSWRVYRLALNWGVRTEACLSAADPKEKFSTPVPGCPAIGRMIKRAPLW